MREINWETLTSLSDKIDALQMSDVEQGIMQELFRRAAASQPEVQGFRFTGLETPAPLKVTGAPGDQTLGQLVKGLGLDLDSSYWWAGPSVG